MRDSEGNLRAFAPWDHIREKTAASLRLTEGLAVPVLSDRGQGQIFLEQVRGLSTDHLEAAAEISAAVVSHIQRQALMKAAEEAAEARSRLAIARDLHDSVVQFLAGAAFRLEAMKRAEASGRDLTPELDELKELMLQEQTELRSFITALRSGSQIELAELARDLQALANRLSRQWNVQCSFSLEEKDIMVPARLHLDAQQLVREAVANAVRHAGAKNVSIRLAGEEGEVTLDFINDGATYSRGPDGDRMPRSIKERVEAAGGAMDISRGMGVTKITVSLPLTGKAA
jgi:signal transduction histidine kinase